MLSPGILDLAVKIQEATTAMSHSDIRSRLSDALNDKYRGTGNYGYLTDVFGDDESGDVIYSKNGDLKKASYSMGSEDGKPMCSIDCDNEKDVVPMTTYTEEAGEDDDADHVASMEAEKLYAPGTDIRLVERYISKDTRAAMPKGDFAGKGTSYPIKSAEDVKAAAHALGRAGSGNLSMNAIKKRIIEIAKRKGFESALPKAWKEAAAPEEIGLRLVESAACMEDIVLRESRADYEIKLIAPGKGSTAFYPREVLKRDGPTVFKAGTHVYLNHPTLAEEAARPEGDVKNLAGVLTGDAVYHESHAKGEGLYGRMKVFADHASLVEEKAAHVGMSIRARGVQESGGTAKYGVPVLKSLTSAESVDVVTKAGAGGLILTESANDERIEGVDMDEAAVKKLIESAVAAATSPLQARAMRGDAMVAGIRALSKISLSEAQKQFVVDTVLRDALPLKEGAFDDAKFGELVIAEAQRFGAAIGGARVTGMGEVPVREAGKSCKTCKGSGEDADGDDCGTCGGSGKMKESRRTDPVTEELTTLCESALGMSKSAAGRAANGRAA